MRKTTIGWPDRRARRALRTCTWPHFELINPTAPGYELQTEYFVSRQQAVDAFRAIEAITVSSRL